MESLIEHDGALNLKLQSGAMTASMDEVDGRFPARAWIDLPEQIAKYGYGIERRTPNLGLIIPGSGAINWGRMVSFNFDVIDLALAELGR